MCTPGRLRDPMTTQCGSNLKVFGLGILIPTNPSLPRTIQHDRVEKKDEDPKAPSALVQENITWSQEE